MNFAISLFLCLFGSGFTAFAQQSILIKIESPTDVAPSYIIATTNNAQVVNFDISAVTSTVIENIDAIAFDWLPDQNEQESIFEIMQVADENTLKKYYKREDNIRYELMVRDKLNNDLEKYWKTKPLFIKLLFQDAENGLGVNYQQQVIFKQAIETTKPTISMLNARQIAAAIDQADFATQAEILSNYVNNAENFRTVGEQNFQNYLNGNINAIASAKNSIDHDAFQSIWIGGVNDLLINRIALLSAQQPTLFIIEAERLEGDIGLISKLINKSFKISYISVSLKNTTLANGSQQNQNEINSDEIEPDNFPDLMSSESQTSTLSTIVFNVSDTFAFLKNKYTAFSDAFGNMLDYASIDTSFLNNWYLLKAADGNFTIKVPVKSDWQQTLSETINGPIKSYSYSQNHAKSDLYYSVGYTIYPPSFDPGLKSAFFDDFVLRQVRKLNGSLVDQRIISDPAYLGREFTVVVDDSFFVRSKLILKGNILYQILTGGPKNNPYSVYAAAFFKSFQLQSNLAGKWFFYEDPSFSANLPTPPIKSNQTYNTQYGPLQVQSFSAEDYQEGVSYFISVNAYPVGYKFKNNKAFYKDLIASAERQYIGKVVDEQSIKKEGIKGKFVTLQLNNNKIYKIYFFFDHNTVVQYLAGGSILAMQSISPQYFFDTFILNTK